MPCYDGWNDHVREDIARSAQMEINGLKNRNDYLTRLLCGLCHAVQDIDIDSVPGLKQWWKEHQKFDTKREHMGHRLRRGRIKTK